MAARNEEREEGELRRGLRKPRGEEVPFEVMDAHDRDPERKAHGVRHGIPGKKGARKTRAFRDGNCRDVAAGLSRLGENFIGKRNNAPDVIAARELGHHAAVGAVHVYLGVERIGKELLMQRQNKKVLSTNIDFYSGFVYEMLGLPMELYTPLFAVARIAGWSAHRMEELSAGGKLIRPRYECVEEHRSYTPMEQR